MMTEPELSADLLKRLEILKDCGRADFAKEVRMVCYTHASKASPVTLRIDYVVNLDGLLIGFEVKRAPEAAADLGRYLTQCAQYACGLIGAAMIDRVNPEWIGKALYAVFLVSTTSGCSDMVLSHGRAAHRLFGPQNVSFFVRQCRHDDGFELRLCAERVWCKESGWHRGMVNKAGRSGNGGLRTADTSDVRLR